MLTVELARLRVELNAEASDLAGRLGEKMLGQKVSAREGCRATGGAAYTTHIQGGASRRIKSRTGCSPPLYSFRAKS